MNKKFKKICAMALTFAITATSVISMSLSADCVAIIYPFRDLYDFTVVDDSAMNQVGDGGKLLYKNGCFYKADPVYALARFILSEDVNYEEVNDRVIEIFKEFYPDNYLDVPECPAELMPPEGSKDEEDYAAYHQYWENYCKNYKPNLWSETIHGVTIYTLSASAKYARSLNDEKVAAARKCSKDFMKKLNEEKLISKFYDFGEVYSFNRSHSNDLIYSQNDIDLINNYIKENNIDCTLVKKSDGVYKLQSNDNDKLKAFLAAVDIYKATSIRMQPFFFDLSGSEAGAYGKNSLEELWSIGDVNGDDKITVRDCLLIAQKLARREGTKLPDSADYNKDGKKNIKDAADIAIDIAKRNIG